jgi:hypothetical protein
VNSGAREARRARQRAVRRRRAVALGVVVAVLAGSALAIALTRHDPKATSPPTTTAARVHVRAKPPPAVEAGLLPWQLPVPLSREVVAARSARGLVVLGGLAASASTDGVDLLDTRTGKLSASGTLVHPSHDAAGAALGPRVLVIGGGTTAPAASTQIETRGRTVA